MASTVQVLAVVLGSVALASRGARRVVESLVVKDQREVSGRVEGHVRGLVQEARGANEVQPALAAHGGIDLHDEARWRAVHLDLAARNPHGSYLTIADEDGGWFGLQIPGGPRWGRTEYDVFAVEPDGSVEARTERVEPYDSWQKDWYRLPARTGQPR